jgi:hypothetical protein
MEKIMCLINIYQRLKDIEMEKQKKLELMIKLYDFYLYGKKDKSKL